MYKKISLWIAIILVLAASATTFVHAQDTTCDPTIHYLFQGNDAYAAGDYAGAIAAYTCATQNERDQAAAYNSRGNSYRQLGDFAAALVDYNRSLEVDESNALVISNRGWIYYKMGELDTALADFNQALVLDPDNAYAHNNRGVVYAEMGRSGDAADEFDRALALGLQPSSWAIFNRDTLAGFETAPSPTVQQPVDSAITLVGSAWSTFHENDFDGAIDLFSQAIEQNPNSYAAYFGRGTTYAFNYQYHLARPDFDRAVELNTGHDFAVFINRGILNLLSKDYQAAVDDFTSAIEVGPKPFCSCDTSPYTGRGYAYSRLGETDKAFADYAETLASRPDDAPTLVLRSILYNAQGNTDAARNDYQHWTDVMQLRLETLVMTDEPFNVTLEPGVVFHIPVKMDAGQKLSVTVNLKTMSDMSVCMFLLDENGIPVIPSADTLAPNAASIEAFTAPLTRAYTVVVTYAGGSTKKGDISIDIAVSN
jgi:tetratricopeptide (TPR) repeat protein